MIFEAMVGFRGCNRYVAHSKIDDALRHLPREGLRNWHPSVVQTGDDSFVGAVRTKSKEVMAAMPKAVWRQLELPKVGESSTCFVELVPKKSKQFADFRNPELALAYLKSRLDLREVFNHYSCEFVARAFIDIAKQGNAYHCPSVWFSVSGNIRSGEAFEDLVLRGIGGAHSFGVGLFNPKESAIHTFAGSAAATAKMRGELVNL
jgi:hypothetical protein